MVSVPRPRIVSRSTDLEAEDLPEQVTSGLRELVGAAKEGLLALSVGVGLAVVQELFEAEVTRQAGPKGKHDPDRRAYRHGQEDRRVTLGGRRVQVSKPRVRSVADAEIELRTFRAFAKRDVLNEAALGRMLAGLSTRQYPVGLEPMGQVEALGTSKSAVSQRFIEGTERKLAELFGRDLSQLKLVAMFIDGVEIAEHCLVVALGVDADGRKHPLGLWEGTTENKTVCNALLGNLIERGLPIEQPRLFVIDGGKAIRAAVMSTFGTYAVIQRCREHKRRNVLEHLPQAERLFVSRKLNRAWSEPEAKRAEGQLRALATQLEANHPGAAAKPPGRTGGNAHGHPARPEWQPPGDVQVHQPHRVDDLHRSQGHRQRQAVEKRQDGVALDGSRPAGCGETVPESEGLSRDSHAPTGTLQAPPRPCIHAAKRLTISLGSPEIPRTTGHPRLQLAEISEYDNQ
jgi:putative transposase